MWRQSDRRKDLQNFTLLGFCILGMNSTRLYTRMVDGETCCTGSRRTILDMFFNDWADDSWDEEHGFDNDGEFQQYYADNTTTEDPIMVELEELPYALAEEQVESVNVITIAKEFVGLVEVNGHESWLSDSAATC
jgi:hypothetical protein